MPSEPVPQVIFTYAIAIISLWLVCGEAYGQLTGTGVNAFNQSSGVTTIASFGVDNALPFLLSGLGANLELGTFKPPDHFLLNYFYYLEGAKFSTSRGHVIWAGDIAAESAVGSDTVRGYLARVNPEHKIANFDLKDFLGFVNRTLAVRFQDAVSTSWPQIYANGFCMPSGQLMQHLGQLLDRQTQSFDPLRFHLRAAWDAVDTWFDNRPAAGSPDTYWWLKGLALLSYPFLPKFGTTIWQALGHRGFPTVLEFKEPLRPYLRHEEVSFQRIKAVDLSACLPPTLQPTMPEKKAV